MMTSKSSGPPPLYTAHAALAYPALQLGAVHCRHGAAVRRRRDASPLRRSCSTESNAARQHLLPCASASGVRALSRFPSPSQRGRGFKQNSGSSNLGHNLIGGRHLLASWGRGFFGNNLRHGRRLLRRRVVAVRAFGELDAAREHRRYLFDTARKFGRHLVDTVRDLRDELELRRKHGDAHDSVDVEELAVEDAALQASLVAERRVLLGRHALEVDPLDRLEKVLHGVD
mmetsp:Transcript_36972/g.91994  ORF Transcript_36972/g.91994 Transcript_36972/m.91994 type:complete len:229 (-) Transcript_36972:492-1178(-)